VDIWLFPKTDVLVIICALEFTKQGNQYKVYIIFIQSFFFLSVAMITSPILVNISIMYYVSVHSVLHRFK